MARGGGATTTLVVGLLILGTLASADAQVPARAAREHEVHEIAAQLRCVVCQNLSVADSPSEMASQMRGVIRERLAAGDRPDQVVQYFVDKYGEWILLAPRRQGFTLLVWVLPPLVAVLGLVVVGARLAHWTRRAAARRAPPAPVEPAMAERIRREMEHDA